MNCLQNSRYLEILILVGKEIIKVQYILTLNRPRGGGGGGGGGKGETASSLCCAETVSSRKLKFCDFYYILLMSFHFEYKPVLWDIHSCHGNAIIESAWSSFG